MLLAMRDRGARPRSFLRAGAIYNNGHSWHQAMGRACAGWNLEEPDTTVTERSDPDSRSVAGAWWAR